MVHMDITQYVDHLRRDLTAAAELGSEEVQAAAQRLMGALEPAARLMLMEALSAASDEVTAELPAGSVDVRLDGRDLRFVVTLPTPEEPPPTATRDDDADEEILARVTLRIPESLKTRAEARAAEDGTSLNTWLVNVVRAATHGHPVDPELDLSSRPLGSPFGGRPFGRAGLTGRRLTGWI